MFMLKIPYVMEYLDIYMVAMHISHTRSTSGIYVIDVGVHVYVCGQKNHTLAINLPFQTLVVDFSLNL